jgi:hypothetical protein
MNNAVNTSKDKGKMINIYDENGETFEALFKKAIKIINFSKISCQKKQSEVKLQ